MGAKNLELSIDDIARTSLLFDFYGELLTKRQQDVMRMYHEENLTLSEIGHEFGISRQGVHNTLKSASNILDSYENKLKLVSKLMSSHKVITEISSIIDEVLSGTEDRFVMGKLKQIKETISGLED